MNYPYGESQDEANVPGFEVPTSPDSSYNNSYPWTQDDARDPPMVPPHLHQSLLDYPTGQYPWGPLPLPQNVILNHLYIDNSQTPRSVMAVGVTHRFRSRFVTVVLYTPVRRTGSNFQRTGSSSRN